MHGYDTHKDLLAICFDSIQMLAFHLAKIHVLVYIPPNIFTNFSTSFCFVVVVLLSNIITKSIEKETFSVDKCLRNSVTQE